MLQLHMACIGVLLSGAALAAETPPEISRPLARPQQVGVTHTLRVIPETCARLEGRFTGDAAAPYAVAAVRTSARCHPRAKLVDAATVTVSARNGWILNDVIRVPAAACMTQQAVVRVWRKDAGSAVPTMDAQGRARLYLKDGLAAAASGQLGAVPQYAVAMRMEGAECRPNK